MAKLVDLPAGRQARTLNIEAMYFIYAIKSKDKNYIYVGLTNNLDRRMGQHNAKKEKTTRRYAPFEIILTEEYRTRAEARQREKYLKSGCGKEFLKNTNQ